MLHDSASVGGARILASRVESMEMLGILDELR